jgi:hypothetical protein
MYKNSWHRMWACRMRLPASLPTTLDTARYATERAQSTTLQGANESLMRSSSFSTFLESVFTTGIILHLAGTKSVQMSPDYQALQAAAGWWLSDAASTVVAAVRAYHEALLAEGIRWVDGRWLCCTHCRTRRSTYHHCLLSSPPLLPVVPAVPGQRWPGSEVHWRSCSRLLHPPANVPPRRSVSPGKPNISWSTYSVIVDTVTVTVVHM